MSEIVDGAVKALNERLNGQGFEGSVKFVLSGAGAVRIDEQGASVDDSGADCTISADPETFEAMIAGDLDPTSAFMSGRLTVEGDMGTAMRLASLLA